MFFLANGSATLELPCLPVCETCAAWGGHGLPTKGEENVPFDDARRTMPQTGNALQFKAMYLIRCMHSQGNGLPSADQGLGVGAGKVRDRVDIRSRPKNHHNGQQHTQERRLQQSAPTTQTRRYSLTTLLALPLIDGIKNEARMWTEEAAYYVRQGANALQSASHSPNVPLAPTQSKTFSQLNPEFASALLTALDTCAGAQSQEYLELCQVLREQELSNWRSASACGHCGTTQGPLALSDRNFFDYESYIRGKALLSVKQSAGIPKNAVQLTTGELILKHILREIDVGDAAASGIAPIRPTGDDALLSASPELDSFRPGVRNLFKYFRRKGFMGGYGVVQIGVSDDEDENHATWAQGEPAFLQYWLDSPADWRSVGALSVENGFPLSFIGATITAYAHRCGINANTIQRIKQVNSVDNQIYIEQMTLRRFKPLAGRVWERYSPWKPDPWPKNQD